MTTFSIVPSTGIASTDALLYGTRWGDGVDIALSFSFPGPASLWDPLSYGNPGEPNQGFLGLDRAAEQQAVRSALAAWASVANLSFVEVNEPSSIGTLRFGYTSYGMDGTQIAYAYLPTDSALGGDVWLNVALRDGFFANLTPGGPAYATLLHEIGHTLGLKHPHEPSVFQPATLGPNDDSLLESVMSYYAVPNVLLTQHNLDRLPTTPMSLDIDAIQALYGANASSHPGDDLYVFDGAARYLQTIYDTGGNDTIQLTGSAVGEIDLRPGEWSLVGIPIAVNGTPQADLGTVRIYHASLIENAIGSDGADTLIGNDADNRLTGGGGNDTLEGGAGTDAAAYAGAWRQFDVAGNPATIATLQGPEGIDTLSGVEQLVFIDGSLNFDAHSHIAQVERLYLSSFNRAPDAIGLNYHLDRLDHGVSLETIAQEFAESAEFVALYGALNNTAFVEQLYQNVLHRASDPGGASFWINFLATGGTRGAALMAFSESGELIFSNAPVLAAGLWDIDEAAGSVARLYLGALGRIPDAAGLAFHVNEIKAGRMTLAQDAQNFVNSPEFLAHYGALDDAQFVERLYQGVLDRHSDPDGFAYWTNFLATGTRGQALLNFTDSLEFQVKTIEQIEHGIALPNVLAGTPGNDVINGTAMGEVLNGLAGNDALDGGAGFDVAQYAGAYRQFLLTGNPASTATLQGPEGTDTISSVEKLVFLDGSLNFDSHSHVAQIERLYLSAFNRAPDALGLNFHLERLDHGTSLEAIAGDFADSSEFVARYGPLNDGQFVEQLYQNVLNRHSDPGGLAFWTSFLAGGGARGQALMSFSESAEMIASNAPVLDAGLWDIDETAASVARLYFGALGRAPDVAGLDYHVNVLKTGQLTSPQDAELFVQSPEFIARFGSLGNTDFVNQLYLNVLGRPADAGELSGATGELSGGYSRGEVALSLTESIGFQLATIGQIEHGIAAADAVFHA